MVSVIGILDANFNINVAVEQIWQCENVADLVHFIDLNKSLEK
jgi:acyl carrier protein